MEVKAGYKQTEVGVIPEDWKVKKLGELVSLRTGPFGSSVHKSDYINGGIPFINPIHIFNGELFPDPDITLSPQTVARLSEFQLRTNDIILGRRGEMGRCAVVQDDQQGWLCGSGSMIVRPNSKIVPEFLQRIMSSSYTIAKIEEASVGSTMINLNQAVLFGLSIPYPSLPEQDAIAEALSDADALIEALEQLIAKKRQVKQGAMQELLRPKEDWAEKKLRNTAILKARIGWQGLTTKEYLDSGEYYLITGTEFKNGYIDWSNCHYVNASRYKQDKNIQIRKHDVLVTKDGTIGKVALITGLPKPATLNSGVFVIRPIENAFHPEFFYYLLCSNLFTEFLNQLSAGSTINHLYQKDFVNFVYKTPPTIDEQIAISEILSDMDAEIATLEAKLAKARQIKQGMMSALLTGRVRLV